MFIFVFLIATVAIVAIAGLLQDRRRYQRELQSLHVLREEITRQWDSPAQFHSAMLLDSQRLPVNSLVRNRLSTAYRLFAARCPVELGELSELSIQQTELSWTHFFPRFALLGLIVMGVGATFFNLSHTLGNTRLSDVIVDGRFDDQKYQAAVQHITGGFEDAFAASIAAIVGTVFLLCIQNVVTIPAKAKFLNELDLFTQGELLPYFFERGERSAQEEVLLAVVQKLEGVAADFQQLARDTRTNIEEGGKAAGRLESYGQEMGRVIGSFASAIGDNSAFHLTMEHLHVAVSTSENRHQQLLEYFQATTEQMHKQSTALATTQGLLQEFQDTVKNSLKSFFDGVGRLTDSAEKTVLEHHRETVAQTGRHLEQAAESTRRVAGLLDGLAQTTDSLRDRTNQDQARYAKLVGDCAIVLGKIESSVNRFQEKLQDFESPNLQILDRLDHLRTLDSLPPTLERIHTGLRREARAWTGRQHQHHQAQQTHLEAITAAATKALPALALTVTALEKKVSELASASTEVGKGVGHLKHLEAVVPMLQHIVVDLCQTLMDLQQTGAELGEPYVVRHFADEEEPAPAPAWRNVPPAAATAAPAGYDDGVAASEPAPYPSYPPELADEDTRNWHVDGETHSPGAPAPSEIDSDDYDANAATRHL